MKTRILTALFISASLFACKDDDEPTPIIENEDEVITTLTYTLTPANGGDVKVFQFRDLDGDGANPAVIKQDTLEKNTVYTGSLELLNETETPAEDITEEIREEDEDHQFFYQTTNNLIDINYTDTDADGNPVGLATSLNSNSTTAELTITLRHEPNKSAANVSAGDITNAGGETDIEVTFVVYVKD